MKAKHRVRKIRVLLLAPLTGYCARALSPCWLLKVGVLPRIK